MSSILLEKARVLFFSPGMQNDEPAGRLAAMELQGHGSGSSFGARRTS